MLEMYVALIIKGEKTLGEVPQNLQPNVQELLITKGYFELATNEVD